MKEHLRGEPVRSRSAPAPAPGDGDALLVRGLLLVTSGVPKLALWNKRISFSVRLLVLPDAPSPLTDLLLLDLLLAEEQHRAPPVLAFEQILRGWQAGEDLRGGDLTHVATIAKFPVRADYCKRRSSVSRPVVFADLMTSSLLTLLATLAGESSLKVDTGIATGEAGHVEKVKGPPSKGGQLAMYLATCST